MSTNSDRFLDAFSAIEKHLRRITKSGPSLRFYELLDIAGKSDAAVRSVAADLQQYARLRNAIVHERKGGFVIAEPNDYAVTEIEQIASLLTKPPVLRDVMTHEVTTFEPGQSIAEAVKYLYQNSFSQAPVYHENHFIGLLTTNTIARWLGANVADDIFSLKETTVGQVLGYTEDPDHVIFLTPQTSVYEVLAAYNDSQARGKRLDAVLITHSGERTEQLLGILTVWDFPKLYDAIALHSR